MRSAGGFDRLAFAGASAVSNGSAGGPANGALIITSERKTSGRTTVHHAASGDPKSWPTTADTDL